MTILTDRFTRAVDYARIAHATQIRKGSGIPYLYHPLAVASLVIEFGGDEDQAIAGLLHDVVEDCGQAHAVIIRQRFGDEVATIVEACTDGTVEGKTSHSDPDARWNDWMRRKLAYIAHLDAASDGTLLVSACDKLHNARAIVQDLEGGHDVFARFTGKRDGTLAYYHALAKLFEDRKVAASAQLATVVRRMLKLVDCAAPATLPQLAAQGTHPPSQSTSQPLS
jgi:(p)ppGpp synthase/HD superfamily hydrolase